MKNFKILKISLKIPKILILQKSNFKDIFLRPISETLIYFVTRKIVFNSQRISAIFTQKYILGSKSCKHVTEPGARPSPSPLPLLLGSGGKPSTWFPPGMTRRAPRAYQSLIYFYLIYIIDPYRASISSNSLQNLEI